MADNVEKLRKTDEEWAAEIRADLHGPLSAICEVMNKAKATGIVVNFAIGQDQYGRFRPPDISIVRPL